MEFHIWNHCENFVISKKYLTLSLGCILLLAIPCVQLWHQLGIRYAFVEFLLWDQAVFLSHAHSLPRPRGTVGLSRNICKPCANPRRTRHHSISAWYHHCRLVSQPNWSKTDIRHTINNKWCNLRSLSKKKAKLSKHNWTILRK